MAAYRWVYDSRYLQADCQEPGSAPDLRSIIEYGLFLLFCGSYETKNLSKLALGISLFILLKTRTYDDGLFFTDLR